MGQPQDTPLKGLRILFGAATFPNRTQPWVLSWIVESVRNGAEAEICAFGRLGTTYQAAVDEYRLLDHTTYLRISGVRSSLRSLATAMSGNAPLAQRTRRGLRHVAVGSSQAEGWTRQRVKNIALAPLLGLERVSLIHSHSMKMSYPLLAAVDAWRVPLIMTFHGLPPHGVNLVAQEKQAEVFRRASLMLVNTEFARRQLASLGCPEERIAILPQGTSPEDFPFEPQPHPGAGPLRLLTVGRLHEDKGHRHMLAAVRELKARGRNIEYSIVGIGPIRAALEQLAQELGITDSVRFHGEVDDAGLREQYRTAHVFVLPSVRSQDGYHEETQGVVLQEAQACGKLVIATRTGGVPECIDDGHSAFLVLDRDPEALARQVETLLDHPERWHEWQNAARRWVEERYSMPVLGRRLARIYLDVLEKHRA